MSKSEQQNLSGYWSGEFTYEHSSEVTPFNIFLEDVGGVISGTTLEPNTFADPSLEELSATIAGERSGQTVSFRKLYDKQPGAHQMTIHYAGEVNEDFTLIQGEWNYPNVKYPRGGFRLTRSSGGASEEAVEDEATTGASA